MSNVVSVTLKPPFKDIIAGVLDARQTAIREGRNMLRIEGRRMVDLMREEAPAGKTGKFRKGIFYRTYEREQGPILRVYAPQPLATFIALGTKPHRIAAKQAGALSFDWPKFGGHVIVPKGGGFPTHVRGNVLWIGKGYVDHPGTRPNRFPGRAYRRWYPGARVALRGVAQECARTITGARQKTRVLGL